MSSSYLPGPLYTTRMNPMGHTGVFMDVEDYPIPEFLDPESFSEKIDSALEEKGYRGQVSIYLFADKKNTLPKEVIEQYEDAGIIINFLPEEVKNVRVHHMILEILLFVLSNHEKQSNLVLLSKNLKEDREAVSSLKGLNARGYKILISDPSPKLRFYTGSSQWIWTSLSSDGENPSFPSGSSQHADKKRKMRADSED